MSETALVNCGQCGMKCRVDFTSQKTGKVYKVCKCIWPNVAEDGTFDLAEDAQ